MFLKAKEGEEGPESQVPSRSWEKRWDQRENGKILGSTLVFLRLVKEFCLGAQLKLEVDEYT